MADHDEQQPTAQEMAALELYHQLINLSPDNGDRDLMVTLRLPNGRYVGDVWLSQQDVEHLTDGAMAIADQRNHFSEQAADPLPVDDTVTAAEVNDVFSGFAALLGSEDGEL